MPTKYFHGSPNHSAWFTQKHSQLIRFIHCSPQTTITHSSTEYSLHKHRKHCVRTLAGLYIAATAVSSSVYGVLQSAVCLVCCSQQQYVWCAAVSSSVSGVLQPSAVCLVCCSQQQCVWCTAAISSVSGVL